MSNKGDFLNFLTNDIKRLRSVNRKLNKTRVYKQKCSQCSNKTNGILKTIINNKPMYFCTIECFEKKNI